MPVVRRTVSRAVGRPLYGHVITRFSRMGRLFYLPMVLRYQERITPRENIKHLVKTDLEPRLKAKLSLIFYSLLKQNIKSYSVKGTRDF